MCILRSGYETLEAGMELHSLALWQAAELIRQHALSPVELTQALLERIAALDGELHCFITLTPELALQQARQAEKEILQGAWRGPLHGIPLAYKDLYETRRIRTTAGTTFFADYFPEQDAAVVERLAEQGAGMLGKTNLHEIALGITNENPHYGVCRNPWDKGRITGGSSGGSAAALAAGFCPGALGSDTGGSIRIPASLCGVVGFKPTRGRVSLRGVIPLSWNLDHAGPLARCVRDVALLFQAMAGADPQDPYSLEAPLEDYPAALPQGVSGWRVALAEGEFFEQADPAVREAVRQAGLVFERLGAQVVPVSIPGIQEMAQANNLMVVTDAAAFHRQRLETNPLGFGEDVRLRLQTGASTSAVEYIQARRVQSLARHWFGQFFQDYDILLLPATPSAAPPITLPLEPGSQAAGSTPAIPEAVLRARQLTRFTGPFNLTGLPAISVPCGWIVEGQAALPVGLQIVGRAWDELHVLQAAYAFEQTGQASKRFSGQA
jgi:aspartyl-tRNA(Asn)/glutamyl-tRNA(Gln) amidotransferase subunit A